MPTLLELERAVYRSLVERDDEIAARHIVADGLAPEARLNVYRNTFVGTLTTALRLSFPAVHRLVGADFFESAARIFIESAPPHSAYLDEYGGEFSRFLEQFPHAASLPYLPGVARLEWAVSHALHAPDADVLDISRLSIIDPGDQGRIVLLPHPSIGLVHADHPVDEIWRSVLAQDDKAMMAIDLDIGPLWLVIQRLEHGLDITRLNESEWRFLADLCSGRPLEEAMASMPDGDATTVLAKHLAVGRFVGFEILDRNESETLPGDV